MPFHARFNNVFWFKNPCIVFCLVREASCYGPCAWIINFVDMWEFCHARDGVAFLCDANGVLVLICELFGVWLTEMVCGLVSRGHRVGFPALRIAQGSATVQSIDESCMWICMTSGVAGDVHFGYRVGIAWGLCSRLQCAIRTRCLLYVHCLLGVLRLRVLLAVLHSGIFGSISNGSM